MIIIFKIILLAALAWSGYLFFFRLRSRFFQRILVLLSGVSLVVFIVVPEISTKVAGFFGVGRGTDFILYLCQVFLCILIIVQNLKIQKLDEQLTHLVRTLAIREVTPPHE